MCSNLPNTFPWGMKLKRDIKNLWSSINAERIFFIDSQDSFIDENRQSPNIQGCT